MKPLEKWEHAVSIFAVSWLAVWAAIFLIQGSAYETVVCIFLGIILGTFYLQALAKSGRLKPRRKNRP